MEKESRLLLERALYYLLCCDLSDYLGFEEITGVTAFLTDYLYKLGYRKVEFDAELPPIQIDLLKSYDGNVKQAQQDMLKAGYKKVVDDGQEDIKVVDDGQEDMMNCYYRKR